MTNMLAISSGLCGAYVGFRHIHVMPALSRLDFALLALVFASSGLALGLGVVGATA